MPRDTGHPLLPETPKIIDQSCSRDTTSEEKTYLVSSDVEVERGYRPEGRQTTCSARLNMVKYRVVSTTTTSGTKGTDAFHTSLIGEDAGEGLRHVDEDWLSGEFR